jgi:hypothetical protein
MASKWDKMMSKVSDKQIALARKFQSHDITSYSQAIKAFANRDDAQIETWKRQLTVKTQYERTLATALTASDLWDGDPTNTTAPAPEMPVTEVEKLQSPVTVTVL